MRPPSLWLILALGWGMLHSQNHRQMASFSPGRLASASVMLRQHADPEVLISNPAYLSCPSLSGGAWVSHPWGIRSLAVLGMYAGGRIKKQALAMALHHLNHTLYHETVVYAGSSRQLETLGTWGATLYAGQCHIHRYPLRRHCGLTLGFARTLGSGIHLGLSHTQPLSNEGMAVNTVQEITVQWQIQSEISIGGHIQRTDGRYIDWHFAAAWTVHPGLEIQCAVSPAQETFHLGLCLNAARWRAQYATALHPLLGQIHSMGCQLFRRTGESR